jgi:MFS family permease
MPNGDCHRSYHSHDNLTTRPRLFNIPRYAAKWQTWYSLLYTVYSIPNVILPFFGGFLVDKLGVVKMLLIFNLFLVAGT